MIFSFAATLGRIGTRLAGLAAALLAVMLLAGCAADIADPPASLLPPPVDNPDPVDPKDISFRLAPFSGAPGNLTDKLTRIIVEVAGKQKLNLIRRPSEAALYRIVGNLNAVGDDSGATVIYSFVVYDQGNRKVHEIHGQEVSSGSRGDPWAGVKPVALRNIAERTVDALKAWVARRTG